MGLRSNRRVASQIGRVFPNAETMAFQCSDASQVFPGFSEGTCWHACLGVGRRVQSVNQDVMGLMEIARGIRFRERELWINLSHPVLELDLS